MPPLELPSPAATRQRRRRCGTRSKKHPEPLDTFEQDVPITAADNEALWRVREHNAMDAHEYLEFLLRFTKDLPPSREPDGPWPGPFEL